MASYEAVRGDHEARKINHDIHSGHNSFREYPGGYHGA
jgi:hypothetical protein